MSPGSVGVYRMDVRRRPHLRSIEQDDRNGWDEYVGESGSHYMRGWRRALAATLAAILLLPALVFVIAILVQVPGRILHW
jgi:hypothetical protein